jgi:hypothetical protein
MDWKTVTIEGEISEWMLLVKLNNSNVSIGMSRNGEWLVGTADDCVGIQSQQAVVRLLAFLEEKSILDIVTVTVPGTGTRGRRSSDAVTDAKAVVERVIWSGLQSQSDYWASLSLDWLDKLTSLEIGESLRYELSQLPEASWASQRTRHRAAAHLQRIAQHIR